MKNTFLQAFCTLEGKLTYTHLYTPLCFSTHTFSSLSLPDACLVENSQKYFETGDTMKKLKEWGHHGCAQPLLRVPDQFLSSLCSCLLWSVVRALWIRGSLVLGLMTLSVYCGTVISNVTFHTPCPPIGGGGWAYGINQTWNSRRKGYIELKLPFSLGT